MESTIDLNLIRTLLGIVETGNLSALGRKRGVTRSQISKELKQLEYQLGTSLIRRSTRRVSLTEPGRMLYEHGLRMVAELAAAARFRYCRNGGRRALGPASMF